MNRPRRNPAGRAAKLRETCEYVRGVQEEIRSAAPQSYSDIVSLIMSNPQLAATVWGDTLPRISEDILDSTPYTENQLDRVLPLLYYRMSRVEVLLGIWDTYSRSVLDNRQPITHQEKQLLSWSVRSLNRLGVNTQRGRVALLTPTARETPRILDHAMQPIGQGSNFQSTLLDGLYFDVSGEIIRKAIVEAS